MLRVYIVTLGLGALAALAHCKTNCLWCTSCVGTLLARFLCVCWSRVLLVTRTGCRGAVWHWSGARVDWDQILFRKKKHVCFKYDFLVIQIWIIPNWISPNGFAENWIQSH